MKTSTRRCLWKSGLFAILLWVLAFVPARAGVYVYDFGHVISGTPPAGVGPWLRATFMDVSPGTVHLKFEALQLSGEENVVKAYFNLNPVLNVTNLALTHSTSFGSFELPQISRQINGFQADGDGQFDILLEFTPDGAGETSRFTTGEGVEYTLTYSDILYPAVLMASDFNYLSLTGGGEGIYFAAAHVQRIGSGQEYSGWVGAAVPEPSSASLFVGALALLFLRPVLFRK